MLGLDEDKLPLSPGSQLDCVMHAVMFPSPTSVSFWERSPPML